MTHPEQNHLCSMARQSKLVWLPLAAILAASIPSTALPLLAATTNVQQSNPTTDASADAENESVEDRNERRLADRFLTVLLKRPRLGTALDRVYGYHVATGNMENFLNDLEKQAISDHNAAAWTVLGLIHSTRGNDLLAIDAFRKSALQYEADAMVWYYLGQAQLQVGDLDEATISLRRAITLKPTRVDSLPIFESLGRVLLRGGKQEEALEVWREMEQQFPDDTQVQELIAQTLTDEGHFDAALTRYDSLKTNIKDPYRQIENALKYSEVLLALDRPADALDELEALVNRVNPSSWLRRELRNRIELVLSSDPNPATLPDYYRDWLEDHPEDIEARNRFAAVLVYQQRYADAKQQLENLIALTPSDPAPRLTLVDLYRREQNPAAAAEQVQALLELDANNPDWILLLGELQWLASDEDESARPTVEATWLRLTETHPDASNYAAIVAEKMAAIGSMDPADRLFRVAIDLSPAESRYRRQLGDLLFQQSRSEDAIAMWNSIAATPRDTAENMLFVAEILRSNKLSAEAIEWVRSASQKELSISQRISVADHLAEANLHSDALKQLDFAQAEAEARTQRRQILEKRAQIHNKARSLAKELERVANPKFVDAVASMDGVVWQPEERAYYHALLHRVSGASAAATQVLSKALDQFPDSAMLLQFAAELSEERGQIAAAIDVYARLARLERVSASQHLEQQCLLELQLQRFDDAMKTAARRAALAPRNLDYSGFYAEVCSLANRTEEAIRILRRRLRQAPRDTDVIGDLAQALAKADRDEEAIEIYWRLFQEQKLALDRSNTIGQMAYLYWQQERFANLISRIESMAEELNQPDSAYLWKAAAYRAVNDPGTALKMLNQLARVRTNDPALLRQLARLYSDQDDYELALSYQTRLLETQVTESHLKDAIELAIKAERTDKAVDLSKRHMELLSDHAKYQIATQLFSFGDSDANQSYLDLCLEQPKPHWEFVLLAAINEYQRKNLEAATIYAKRLLSFETEFSSVGLSNRYLQRQRSAGNRIQGQVAAQSASPSIVLDFEDDFRQLLSAGTDTGWGYGGWGYGYGSYGYGQNNSIRSIGLRPVYLPSLANFGVGKALAWAILSECQPELEKEAWTDRNAEQLLSEATLESLWMVYFLRNWLEPFDWYEEQAPPAGIQKALDALLEKGDGEVARIAIYRLRMQVVPDQPLDQVRLTDAQVAELLRLSDIVRDSNPSGDARSDMQSVFDLLVRSGRFETAEEFMRTSLEQYSRPRDRVWIATQLVRLPYLEKSGGRSGTELAELGWAHQAGNRSTDGVDSTLRVPARSEAFEFLTLQLKSLRQSSSPRSVDRLLDFQISTLSELDLELPPNQVHQLLEVWLEERALFMDSQPIRTMLPYSLSNSPRFGREIGPGIRFPLENEILTTAFLREWVPWFQQRDASGELGGLIDSARKVAQRLENPRGRFFTLAVLATTLAWDKQIDEARSVLHEMETLNCHSELARALQIPLLRSEQKTQEAFELVDRTLPRNASQLLEQERLAIELLLETGQLEAARARAAGLAALRLSADAQLDLYQLYATLGMNAQANGILDRVRLRAGNSIDVKLDLMQRYDALENTDRAKELAFQVLSMTGVSANQYRSEYAMQQALAYLQEIGEAQPLIEQYEQLRSQSPGSSVLTQQLLQLYEVCGESQKAAALNDELEAREENSPLQVLVRDGLEQFELMEYEQAHEALLAAIEADANVLISVSEQLFPLLKEFGGWDRFWSALESQEFNPIRELEDLDSFAQAIFETGQQEKLATAFLECMPDLEAFDALEAVQKLSTDADSIETEFLIAVARRLLKQTSQWADANNLIGTASYEARLPGFFSFVSLLAKDSTAAQKTYELLETRRESLGRSSLELALLTEQGRSDEYRALVEARLSKSAPTTNDLQALLFHVSFLMGKQSSTSKRSSEMIGEGLALCQRLLEMASVDPRSPYAQHKELLVSCKQFALEKLEDPAALLNSLRDEIVESLREEVSPDVESEIVSISGYGSSYSGYSSYYGSAGSFEEQLTRYASETLKQGALLDALVASLASQAFDASPSPLDTWLQESRTSLRSKSIQARPVPFAPFDAAQPIGDWFADVPTWPARMKLSQVAPDSLVSLAIHLASEPGLASINMTDGEATTTVIDAPTDIERQRWILDSPIVFWPSVFQSAPLKPSVQFIVLLQEHESWDETIRPMLADWLDQSAEESNRSISQWLHRIVLAEICTNAEQAEAGWRGLMKQLKIEASVRAGEETSTPQRDTKEESPQQLQLRRLQQQFDTQTLRCLTTLITRLEPSDAQTLLLQATEAFTDRASPISLMAAWLRADSEDSSTSMKERVQDSLRPLFAIDNETSSDLLRDEAFMGSNAASWFEFDDEQRLSIGLELSIIAAHNDWSDLAIDLFSRSVEQSRFLGSRNYYGGQDPSEAFRNQAVVAARNWLAHRGDPKDASTLPPNRIAKRQLYERLRDYIFPIRNENQTRNLLRAPAASLGPSDFLNVGYEEPSDCLAFVLADIAISCGMAEDLQERAGRRIQLPGTSATALAIQIRLLQEASLPAQLQFFSQLRQAPGPLVTSQHHETAMAAILQGLDSLNGPNGELELEQQAEIVALRDALIPFLIRITKQHHRDESNAELTVFLSKKLADCVRQGELANFENLERWLRELMPAEDRPSYEVEMRLPLLENAATTALLLGHEDLALRAIELSLEARTFASELNRNANSQFPDLCSRDHAAGRAFLTIAPEKRIAQLWAPLWNLPDLGLNDYSYFQPPNLGHWYLLSDTNSASAPMTNCLLTQLLEDQLRLRNYEEIANRIQSLDNSNIQFAAKIAFAVAASRLSADSTATEDENPRGQRLDTLMQLPATMERIPRLNAIWQNEATTAEVEAWRLAWDAGNRDVAEDYQKRAESKRRLLGWSNAADVIQSQLASSTVRATASPNSRQEQGGSAEWTTGARIFSEQPFLEFGDRSIRVSSRQGGASVIYRSPLTGDFELRCQLAVRAGADATLSFGGLIIRIDPSYGYFSSVTSDYSYYESGSFPSAKGTPIRLRLQRVDERLRVSIGRQTLADYSLPVDPSPWLSLGVLNVGQATFSEIEFSHEKVSLPKVQLLEDGAGAWTKAYMRFDAERLIQLMSEGAFAAVGGSRLDYFDFISDEKSLWTFDNETLTLSATRSYASSVNAPTSPGSPPPIRLVRDPTLLARSHRFFPRGINVGETLTWESAWQPRSGSTPEEPAFASERLHQSSRIVCLLGDLVIARSEQVDSAAVPGGWHLARLLPPGQVVELSESELETLVIDAAEPSAISESKPQHGDWDRIRLEVESDSVRLLLNGENELRLRRHANRLPLLGFGITSEWNMKVRDLTLAGAW